MMTAVNTNDSPYQLPKINSFGYPDCHYQKPGHILNDCLFFLLTIFFSAMVSIFFCAWLWLFRARVPKQRLLRRGWDGSQNGFPKSPARRFRFWFLHTAFLGAERNGNGNNVHVGFSLLFYFCPQYSTWKALSGR